MSLILTGMGWLLMTFFLIAACACCLGVAPIRMCCVRLRRFFEDYKKNEHKDVKVDDILGAADAMKCVIDSLNMYQVRSSFAVQKLEQLSLQWLEIQQHPCGKRLCACSASAAARQKHVVCCMCCLDVWMLLQTPMLCVLVLCLQEHYVPRKLRVHYE